MNKDPLYFGGRVAFTRADQKKFLARKKGRKDLRDKQI